MLCLTLMTAAVLLVPVRALGSERLSPLAVQGLEQFSRAKAAYTVPTVSAWPTAGAITFGQTLASSTLTGGAASAPGRFVFAAPTTKPDAGNYVADVLFTPTDTVNFVTVSGTVSVSVNTATPTVTAWPAAGAINLGDSLASSSFTGGAASVPGTFAFTAPATVPGGTGNFAAAVTFTPADTTNYGTVTGTVDVTVNTAPVSFTWDDYVGIPVLVLAALGIVQLAELGRGGGPCFIATAAYGTPLAPEVERLREFRDNTLLTGVMGTAAVDVYYRVSPAIADLVAASPTLAMLVRMLLIPVILLVSLPKPLLAGLGLLTVTLLARWFVLHRRQGKEQAK
jgi:hypothetical protein